MALCLDMAQLMPSSLYASYHRSTWQQTSHSLAFVGLENAYDCVPWDFIWWAVYKILQKVSRAYIPMAVAITGYTTLFLNHWKERKMDK